MVSEIENATTWGNARITDSTQRPIAYDKSGVVDHGDLEGIVPSPAIATRTDDRKWQYGHQKRKLLNFSIFTFTYLLYTSN